MADAKRIYEAKMMADVQIKAKVNFFFNNNLKIKSPLVNKVNFVSIVINENSIILASFIWHDLQIKLSLNCILNCNDYKASTLDKIIQHLHVEP